MRGLLYESAGQAVQEADRFLRESRALEAELSAARAALQTICASFPTSEDDCQHVAHYLAEQGLMNSGGLPPSAGATKE